MISEETDVMASLPTNLTSSGIIWLVGKALIVFSYPKESEL